MKHTYLHLPLNRLSDKFSRLSISFSVLTPNRVKWKVRMELRLRDLFLHFYCFVVQILWHFLFHYFCKKIAVGILFFWIFLFFYLTARTDCITRAALKLLQLIELRWLMHNKILIHSNCELLFFSSEYTEKDTKFNFSNRIIHLFLFTNCRIVFTLILRILNFYSYAKNIFTV